MLQDTCPQFQGSQDAKGKASTEMTLGGHRNTEGEFQLEATLKLPLED